MQLIDNLHDAMRGDEDDSYQVTDVEGKGGNDMAGQIMKNEDGSHLLQPIKDNKNSGTGTPRKEDLQAIDDLNLELSEAKQTIENLNAAIVAKHEEI